MSSFFKFSSLCLSFTLLTSCSPERGQDLSGPVGGKKIKVGIVGGSPVPAGNYPGVVALVGPDGIFCSGTLIHPRVVLTAAHCVDTYGADKIGVYVGSGAEQGKVEATMPAEKIGHHPSYHAFFGNAGYTVASQDVGYVVLKAGLNIPTIPILLTKTDLAHTLKDDQVVTLIGYGKRNPGLGVSSWDLFGVKHFASSVIKKILPFEMEIWSEGKYVNSGDSGGPVLVETPEGPKVMAINSRISVFLSDKKYPIHRYVTAWPYVCWLESETQIDLSPKGACHGRSEKYAEGAKKFFSNPFQTEDILNEIHNLAQFAAVLNLRDSEVRGRLIDFMMLAPRPEQKLAIFDSLKMLGLTYPEFMSVFDDIFKTANPDLSQSIIDLLVTYDKKDEATHKALVLALNSPHESSRFMAYEAVDALRMHDSYMLEEFLKRVVVEPNSGLKEKMKEVLFDEGAQLGKVRNFFAELIKDNSNEANYLLAIEAVGRLEIDSDEVIDTLIQELVGSDYLFVNKASLSLQLMTRKTAQIMEKVFSVYAKLDNEEMMRGPEMTLRNIGELEERIQFLEKITQSNLSDIEKRKARKLLREIEEDEKDFEEDDHFDDDDSGPF